MMLLESRDGLIAHSFHHPLAFRVFSLAKLNTAKRSIY